MKRWRSGRSIAGYQSVSDRREPMADRFHINEGSQWSRRTMLAFAGSAATIGTMTANTAKSAQTQEKMQMGDNREIEQIYQRWDNAFGKKDLEAALALYADDASI